MSTLSPRPDPALNPTALRRVLASGERPRHPNALSASLTFGWRALLKIKHVPWQLLDVTAIPVMFTLLFTYLFGGALAGSTGDYLQYLLPGILVQAVIFITSYTGLAINTDISKGIFERFRSLPIWRPAPLVGALLGDAGRYTIASIIVIGLGLILGFRPAGGVVGMVLAVLLLLLFSFSLSWIWTLMGLMMQTPEAVMGVSSMILFPLTFASNIFVSPQTMPQWLEVAVNLNPITHLVTAVRALMAGQASFELLAPVLLACTVLIAIFAPLTMVLYRRKGSR